MREKPASASKPGPKVFKGPVAVLVDSRCSAACESTLEVLRLYPRVRVFGERSAGVVHFSELGVFTLPKSGVRLGVPTVFADYGPGKFFDRVGFAPDEVVAGKDAFEVARVWIEGELGGGK